MPSKNDSWGIEVGSDAIKAIHLVRKGSDIQVAGFEVLPFKKILSTPDLDVDEAIQENLQQFFSRNDVRRSTVVASVPGSAAFAKFAKLPPVDPKKVPDIVRFEAVQQIPFPIEQVEWDYQVFTYRDSPDVEVGIFAITKERVMRLVENYRAAGQSLDGVTLSALAAYNAIVYDQDLTAQSPGVILMDIGTSSTDVIIAEGGRLWLRTLPIGGNNFTESLVRAFKLSFSKAEKLKREAGTSKYSRQIFQAMRPVFTDLIQEMQRTLGYYQSINRDAKVEKLLGFGSSFRLPGLRKFLQQQLQIDVARLDGFHRISVDGKRAADFAEQGLNLVTAYGLALQGLGLERVHANILPARIVKQRVWQAKQPWMAAAAGLLLAANVAAWVKLEIDRNSFEASQIESSAQIERTIGQANQYVQQWRKIEGGDDPRARIETLRRIQDYHDVWPKIMQDLTLAIRALESQPELQEADYEQVQRIPRGERRRIYIDAMTTEYRMNVGASASGGYSAQEVWGVSQQAVGGAEAQAAVSPVAGGAENAVDAAEPPSFVVTVKGTTPHKDGPRLISQHFIAWLQQNSARPDRPYRIIASNKSLQRIEKIKDDPAVDRRAGGDQKAADTSGRRPDAARGRGARVNERASGRDMSAMEEASLDAVLPKNPLNEESKAGDWSFEIQWTVQLLRPEEARQTQEPRSVEASPGAVKESVQAGVRPGGQTGGRS